MKCSTPEAKCAEGIFQMQYLFFLLTLQIKYQGQAEHDTTFEKSQQLTSGVTTSTILLSGWDFIFKCISPDEWQSFKIYSFQITGKCIYETPLPLP